MVFGTSESEEFLSNVILSGLEKEFWPAGPQIFEKFNFKKKLAFLGKNNPYWVKNDHKE